MPIRSKRALLAVSAALMWGCRSEVPSQGRRNPPLPQFATSDSQVFALPTTISEGARVVGVHALGDSSFAVITSAQGGVAIAQARGQVAGVAGAQGMRPSSAAPCTQGGVAIVADGGRVWHLTRDGTLSAEGRLPTLGHLLGLQCETARDLLVLVDGTLPNVTTASLVRVGSALVRVSWRGDSTRVDTLGTYSGRELLRLNPGDPGVEPPFGVTVRFAAGPTRMYLASSDETEITELQTNGRRLGAIDIIVDGQQVSRATVDSAIRASLRDRLAGLPANVAQELVDALAKDRMAPRWLGLAIDPGENVWLAPNAPPDQDGDRAWTVYRTDGARRAKVFLPHDLEVTELGDDYVLGYMRHLPASRGARLFRLQLLGG